MEMSDEYQDMGNPGGGVTMANIPMAHHRHTPDSPLVSDFPYLYHLSSVAVGAVAPILFRSSSLGQSVATNVIRLVSPQFSY